MKLSLLLGATLIMTTLPATASIATARESRGIYARSIDDINLQKVTLDELTAHEDAESLYILAKALYGRGDKECVEVVRRLQRLYPESEYAAEAPMIAGNYYFFQHNWPDALMEYNRVDENTIPYSVKNELIYRRMYSLIRTGHYSEARMELKKLAGAAEYSNAVTFYTAYLDYIDGKFEKAYSEFSRVKPDADINPGYYMAQIEYSRGDYRAAAARCRGLLATRGGDEYRNETERIAGLSLFKLGETGEALPFLESWYKGATHDNPDALYALGNCLYDSAEYGRATEIMQKLTDQRDMIGQGAWFTLGQCALHEGRDAEAALAFEKSAGMDIDRRLTENALYNYAVAVTRGGNIPFSSATDLLERFVTRFPDSEYAPDVEQYLATAYYNDKNYEKALRSINAIRYPSQAVTDAKKKVLYELGILALTSGKANEAVKYLTECTSIKNNDKELQAEASLWLADAQYSLGKYSQAQSNYTQYLNGSSNSRNRGAALYGLAYSQFQQGNYSAAAKNFTKAIDARPALPEAQRQDARLRNADCLYYTGRYKEAAGVYSEVASRGETGADYALYRQAVMAGLQGNISRKLELLNQAETLYPDSRWLASILLEKAVTYEETGRSAEAADTYKRRLAVRGEADTDELWRMASSMHKGGRWADLLEITERIRRSSTPDTDELADLSLYDADALSHLGRGAEAAEIYSRLAQTPASLAGAKGAVAYGHYLISQKRYSEAEKAMSDFINAGTPHEYWLARGFIILADAYSGLGKDYIAKEYLISLRDNYPGEEDDIADMITTRLKKLDK